MYYVIASKRFHSWLTFFVAMWFSQFPTMSWHVYVTLFTFYIWLHVMTCQRIIQGHCYTIKCWQWTAGSLVHISLPLFLLISHPLFSLWHRQPCTGEIRTCLNWPFIHLVMVLRQLPFGQSWHCTVIVLKILCPVHKHFTCQWKKREESHC